MDPILLQVFVNPEQLGLLDVPPNELVLLDLPFEMVPIICPFCLIFPVLLD